jgi:hypothetical protein
MGGIHEATLVVAYCRAAARKHDGDVVTWMSFVQDCVKPCVAGISSQGSFKDLKYKIRYGHQEILGICRSAFLSCYGISKHFLEKCLISLKEEINPAIPRLDTKKLGKKMSVSDIKEMAQKNRLECSQDLLIALAASNTSVGMQCISWMKWYFKLQADQAVRKEELHLDFVRVKTVWREYVADMMFLKLPFYCYSKFVETWISAFPHVKIRKYKCVGGKCLICALLNEVQFIRF